MSLHRTAMLGKIHVAKKQMALDDEAYRDLLERLTGKRSAKDLDDGELARVLDDMRRLGWEARKQPKRAFERSPAQGRSPAKALALWRALHHLGEVEDPAEPAMHAFALEVAGVDAPKWMTSRHWVETIERLKKWCERVGYEVPPTDADGGLAAKQALVREIWRRLDSSGVIRVKAPEALNRWLWHVTGNNCSLEQLTPEELDRAAEKLGRWLRASRSRARSPDRGRD